jgi:hypothetical protein
MDYLVARMRAGGCTRLRVVTRPEKMDVIRHSEEIGAQVILANPTTVSESLLAGLKGLSPRAVALIGFPDTLWLPENGYSKLVRAVRTGCEVALGLFQVERTDLPRSDVIVFDGCGDVAGIAVKPADPPSEWIWGCAAARVSALAGLERTTWPGEHFDRLCRQGVGVCGMRFSDAWLDVGTKEALALAESLSQAIRTAGPRRGPSP